MAHHQNAHQIRLINEQDVIGKALEIQPPPTTGIKMKSGGSFFDSHEGSVQLLLES